MTDKFYVVESYRWGNVYSDCHIEYIGPSKADAVKHAKGEERGTGGKYACRVVEYPSGKVVFSELPEPDVQAWFNQLREGYSAAVEKVCEVLTLMPLETAREYCRWIRLDVYVAVQDKLIRAGRGDIFQHTNAEKAQSNSKECRAVIDACAAMIREHLATVPKEHREHVRQQIESMIYLSL